ncbi:TPR repeat-contatining protein [Paramagnetospirillum magnetotacticum MS-1]|uniref:TPR repeat-contatining protein n=1 Tax=Paramagnetospirillum magnetotacticum MS-1 TaxID=272627 RepID=A0A0C2YU23_PARME|nr:tetratricopeptide repeat protein [Paramagnetospirillum magnetotacticum]KIL98603.1 TPR repeat-contatining protein [Paramagnetospirillum magnetotacticum MS-1]
MSEIEDLDLEFADLPEHAAVIETLWQEAGLARRYGDTETALSAYRRIIALDPINTEAPLAAAQTCRLAGRPRDSLLFCLDLLEMDRQHMGCRLELAEALRQIGQPEEAHAIIDILLMERPDSVQVWCGLAQLLCDEGRLAGAELSLRRALGLHPGFGPAWATLGGVLARMGESDAALDAFHAAIILEPDQVSHQVHLAEALMDLNRIDEAAAHIGRALALDEEDPSARLARARLSMLNGHLATSWQDAQWRHRRPGFARPLLPADPWEGEDLSGTHLLLHAESGLSDSLIMARFIPILARSCAAITLQVQPELIPLLETLPGVTRALPLGQALPDGFTADYATSLDDLPLLMGVELRTIPAEPYLPPPPDRIRHIRVPPSTLVKVGIAWAGERPEDGLPFAHVLELATLPGSLLFSLETGPRSAEAREQALPALITDLSPTIADFADLAGRISEMDMVIAADGPAAHLAAAMGKPVLMMLPHAAHARWMRRRDDSPWYPAMTLLRQPAPGQWDAPLAAARQRMEDLIRSTAEQNDRQRRGAMGRDAAMNAFLAAHLASGDLLVDVGGGNGDHILQAMEHCPDLLVITLEPSPSEADMLRDSFAISGLEEQVEVLTAAAGSGEGHVLAARAPHGGGTRVFALPDWVPAATPMRPIAALLDERPHLASCRVVLRLDQTGWEDDIIAGTGSRPAVVILEHCDGARATRMLAEAGYGLWRFPEETASGALVPFAGEAGPVLALAPGIAPASHYGRDSLPPSPALVEAAAGRAVELSAPAPSLQSQDRVNEAAHLYEQALSVDPFCGMANANLAVLQHMAGRSDAAIAGFTRALGQSRNPAIMANLAGVMRQMGRLGEANSLLAEALERQGESAELVFDLAMLRRDQGRLIEAETLMRKARLLAPERPGVDWALAQILLGSGNLAEGLPLMAHRPIPPSRAPLLPQWDGGDVVAVSVLVEVTPDVGDALLLARFLPMLAARGALVTVSCPDELVALLADQAGIEQVIGEDDPLPDCQMRVSLAALPSLLGSGADLASPSAGYLLAGRGRRSLRDNRLRVGLTWGRGRGTVHRAGLACSLGHMLSLGMDPAISLLALAEEDDLDHIASEGIDALIERPTPQPADLAEMAGLISGLDVVVGGDTAQLHLAAALGKPVLALLPHGFDWRWPPEREDSPWYASVRVFRPDPAGGWRPPLRRVAAALSIMAEKKAHL